MIHVVNILRREIEETHLKGNNHVINADTNLTRLQLGDSHITHTSMGQVELHDNENISYTLLRLHATAQAVDGVTISTEGGPHSRGERT